MRVRDGFIELGMVNQIGLSGSSVREAVTLSEFGEESG